MEGSLENPEKLTPEKVLEIQNLIRHGDVLDGYLNREEETWPDGKGKTITFPDGGQVKILFEQEESTADGR